MQPDIQKNPLPQQPMMNPYTQKKMVNPQQISQNRQISSSTPNCCEKFSKFLTGTTNIPLIVFLILMNYFGLLIFSLLSAPVLSNYFLIYIRLVGFLFALFVWAPLSIKIERYTSTVRYGFLYLINKIIISVCTFQFPFGLQKIYNFIIFETLLIASTNKDKKMKFFCCRITGKVLIVCTFIYQFIVMGFFLTPFLMIMIYTLIYKKCLINKFSISNEKVEKIENCCLIRCLKKRLFTFISLQEILEKEQQKQPLNSENSDASNSNNSSFVSINIYPNNNSGLISNISQMQSMQDKESNNTESSVDSNNNL